MVVIKIAKTAGNFAENKDVARTLRVSEIIPAIDSGEDKIILDFSGITAATQSFIHALISDVIRKYGNDVLKKIYFKNCSDSVQQVVNIVADYMENS